MDADADAAADAEGSTIALCVRCLVELKMAKLFANSGDPDQTPENVPSDLNLHCLPVTHSGGLETKIEISLNYRQFIVLFYFLKSPRSNKINCKESFGFRS